MKKIIVLAIISVVLFMLLSRSEGFETKLDKADSIHNWFNSGLPKSYNNYKLYMGGASNISEYYELNKLYNNNELTKTKIKNVIR